MNMNDTSNSTNGTTSFGIVRTCYILDGQAAIVISFPTNESILVHIFALIVVIILVFTTVFLNGVAILTIWRSRILKEKTSNFTIMLQSIADFGNGAMVMPLIIYRWASEVAGSPSCVAVYVFKKLAMLVFFYTLTTLSAMNFDRYMAILHPLGAVYMSPTGRAGPIHRNLVTNERLLTYVVAACTIQTIIYALNLTHSEIVRPVIITATILFILITVFVYLKIFLRIRAATNRSGMISVEENLEGRMNPSRSKDSKKLSEDRSRKANFLKELKAAKSSFLVVICCLVCYVPATLSFGPLNQKSSFEAIAVKVWFVVLAMLNSSLNSVIYFWLNNKLRKLGKDLIKSTLKSLT